MIGATTIEGANAFLHGKDHVDVIVSAAHLAEESMFGFLEKVRGSPHLRNTMFLILALEPTAGSSRIEVSTRRAGLALGADGYLTMPEFDAQELFARIAIILPALPILQTANDASAATQVATELERKRR